jgi:hypothetical protein
MLAVGVWIVGMCDVLLMDGSGKVDVEAVVCGESVWWMGEEKWLVEGEEGL